MIYVKVALFYFFQLIMYLIFGRAVLSWFIRDYNNPIMRILVSLTEPILKPIRELLSRFNIGGNMIDFSPLVALLIVQLLMALVINVL
ncbi:YggT family protein [Fusibacter paucivorans]|uniref:YggT family protein n=1 Tax=Fusibacter paucivorans TaxID=76009 RepID=A0ABS5PQG1_9FIRM|nr:YggT family protein [Fusibacter paucivorans]MBS7527399.1 YggT family protein [Fusibacter paucivorans]